MLQPFHTQTHSLLCLPLDILEPESFGRGMLKGKFDWIKGEVIESVTLEWQRMQAKHV